MRSMPNCSIDHQGLRESLHGEGWKAGHARRALASTIDASFRSPVLLLNVFPARARRGDAFHVPPSLEKQFVRKYMPSLGNGKRLGSHDQVRPPGSRRVG